MFRIPLTTKSITRIERVGTSDASFQAMVAANAIQAKISVHAGPKAQLGGRQDGMRKALYQAPASVSQPPVTATRTHPATATGKAAV